MSGQTDKDPQDPIEEINETLNRAWDGARAAGKRLDKRVVKGLQEHGVSERAATGALGGLKTLAVVTTLPILSTKAVLLTVAGGATLSAIYGPKVFQMGVNAAKRAAGFGDEASAPDSDGQQAEPEHFGPPGPANDKGEQYPPP